MAEKSNNVAATAAASTLCVVKRGRGKSEEDRESGLGGRGLCEQANLLCCRTQLISVRRPLKSEHATLLWHCFVVWIHPRVISARDNSTYHRSTFNSTDLSQVKSDSTSTSLRSISIFHATPPPSSISINNSPIGEKTELWSKFLCHAAASLRHSPAEFVHLLTAVQRRSAFYIKLDTIMKSRLRLSCSCFGSSGRIILDQTTL